jgi:hypothetical protein
MKKALANRSDVVGSTIRGALASCLFVGAAILGLLSTNQAQVQTCTPPPAGMVSWWPGDGNANDIQGANNGTLQGGATFAPGMVGQAFSFDGVDDYVRVPDNANLYPGAGPLTADAWIKTTSSNQAVVFAHYECANACPSGAANSLYYMYVDGNGRLNAVLRDTAGTTQGLTSTRVVADGVYHHVAMVRNTTGSEFLMYVDGAVEANALLTVTGTIKDDDGEPDPFTIGAVIQGGTINPVALFPGQIDEVEYFNRALSGAEIQAIYNAGSAGKCKPVCTTPPPDMVSWWPGDGNANDIQDGNNGTLQNGAAFAPGKVGQAFSLDGVDDFVEVQNAPNLNPTNQITIDAWYKPVSFNGNGANPIVNKDYVSHTDPFYQYNLSVTGDQYFHDQAAFNFQITAGGIDYFVWTGPNFWTPGNWYHIAGTYDGSNVKLYVNGVLIDSTPASGAMTDYGKNLRIGGLSNLNRTGLDYLPGLVDEVEILNRALSASEIQAIYNAGSAGKCRTCTPPPPNMASWWPGDGNANDIQGSNNGTLQNGATFAPGMVGQAFSFDGIDDYVRATDTGLPFGGAARTLDFWLKPGFNARVPVIYGNFAPSDAFYVLVNGGNACIGQWGGGPPGEPCGPTNVADGNWHHVAMTYDGGSSVLLYVDGALESSVTKTYTTTQTGKLYMGSTVEGSQEYYTGLVDEVEIFNRALSQSEIAAIVNAGSAGKCKAPPYSAQVQQPINADGTSVFTIKRGVVPVKFTLTQGGVATCALPPATIAVTRTSGQTIGAIDEAVYSGAADTGSNFRVDSCQYIYNLSASALGAGTYRVDIKINGRVVGSAVFQLK